MIENDESESMSPIKIVSSHYLGYLGIWITWFHESLRFYITAREPENSRARFGSKGKHLCSNLLWEWWRAVSLLPKTAAHFPGRCLRLKVKVAVKMTGTLFWRVEFNNGWDKINEFMNEWWASWMHGWKEGWMEGLKEGWMEVGMDGKMDLQMHLAQKAT